uniref:Uncharacterized protein n=1 Tax=Lepeophtheirus salmonis TaxID=72036 RepID=A0A0K2VKJ2_LEPSM
MATTGAAGPDSTPPAGATDPLKDESDPLKEDETCSTDEAAPNCPAPYELSGS